MLSTNTLKGFLSQFDYNISLTGNARWIDQKCTPDVLSIIADCVIQYYHDHNDKNADELIHFTANDIWHSKYASDNVYEIFRKPNLEKNTVKNEYDKFFSQPLELLSYSHILTKEKVGQKNYYMINNWDILEYIAIREKNALIFLQLYIEKVLRDSKLWELFENFFNQQTAENFNSLKSSFAQFIIDNTPINKTLECNRIFSKILNPLSFKYKSRGTERGYISKDKITYDKLMYNRINFRDLNTGKEKSISRTEHHNSQNSSNNKAYYRYQSQKAKKFLREFNNKYRNSQSEFLEDVDRLDPAIHIHHIFPESEYSELCASLENLIALTPTQHLTRAHSKGHTRVINEEYQHLLLLAKIQSIQDNLEGKIGEEKIYSFFELLHVLSIGLHNTAFLEIDDMDFTAIIDYINEHYSNC